ANRCGNGEDARPPRSGRPGRTTGEPAMNDTESHLTDAMTARAREVEPQDAEAALAHITRRLDGRRRRAMTVLGAAAALAVVIGAVALLRRDDGGNKVNVTTKPATTTAPASTTPTTTVPPESGVVPAVPAAVWPFAGA